MQKLSKKYHPDLNPDEAAHEKFIELSKGEHRQAESLKWNLTDCKAYEVLSEQEVSSNNPTHGRSME